MKIEIKHRWREDILFSLKTTSIKLAVEAAVKRKIDLSNANLRYANLEDANLRYALLKGADLHNANLRNADLRDANLRDANLHNAILYATHLGNTKLSGADLTPIRDDYWAVLSSSPSAVEGLKAALIAGKIDGRSYTGKCACLVGTIANIKKCPYYNIPELKSSHNRPAEQFFYSIHPGDTPKTNQHSRIAVRWTETWLKNIKATFEKKK